MKLLALYAYAYPEDIFFFSPFFCSFHPDNCQTPKPGQTWELTLLWPGNYNNKNKFIHSFIQEQEPSPKSVQIETEYWI